MTETIDAILIDPVTRTVSAIKLPIYPPVDGGGYMTGPQIKLKDVYPIIGCTCVEFFPFLNGDSGMINEEGLDEGVPLDCFQVGENCQPLAGKVVVVGNDVQTDSFFAPKTTIDEINAKIRWSKRVLRGMVRHEGEVNTPFGPAHGISFTPIMPKFDE